VKAPVERRRPSLNVSAYADIQVELTELIFRKLMTTVVLGTITLVSLTALMAHATGDHTLWFFTALMAALSVLRVATVVAFNRRPAVPLTQACAARWRLLYAGAMIAYCLGFASETLYAFLRQDPTCCLLSALGTYALCALFASHGGILPSVGQFCTVAMLAALDLGLIHHVSEMAIGGIVLNCAFGIVHCRGLRIRFEGLADNLRTKRKLRVLAEQDALTGLANRYQLQQCLAAACQEGSAFAVFFIDLDGFKQVNDTYGHATGDLLLQHVAKRLQSVVRLSDLVARLGGDEFAVLQTPVPSEGSVHALAERIAQALAQPVSLSGREIAIGASIGIHLSGPGEDDPTRILNTADQALYKVKRGGGGAFAFASTL
jgi:diguanylate cyclase (GGDEF)-like protein